MLQLNKRDPRPVYEQIVEGLETMIAQGILPPDSQLPSVRQLAVELSVNPNTIQKAYSDMLNKGIIYSVRGRGNFVSDDSGIRETMIKDIQSQMLSLMNQAKNIGASNEELTNIIRSLSEVINK